MRAVRARDGVVEVVERPEPDSDRVVEVAAVGICGSDLHLVELGLARVTLGHEIAGVVDGRFVAVEPVAHCGECAPCLSGRTAQCEVGTRSVVGIHRDGGMADRLAVGDDDLVDLPDGVDPRDACLVEPLAVAVHALHAVDLAPGARVAIVGAGPIGLACGAVARASGADVDIVVRHEHQGAAAEKLGLGRGPGGEHDVVIEAAATGSALTSAVELARSGADLIIAGTYWGDAVWPGMAAQLKELTIRPRVYYGHHHGEREFGRAAELLAATPEIPDALVTHRFGLDDGVEAFRVAGDRSAGAIKVVLHP